MQNQLMIPINYKDVLPMYLISMDGSVNVKSDIDGLPANRTLYHSSNGYDYILLLNTDYRLNLYPIDEIIGYAFIPIPQELSNKNITIKHINGDTRDNTISNLEWVEDIEMWKDIDIPQILMVGYQISNFGNIKAPNNHIINSPHLIAVDVKAPYKRVYLNKMDTSRKGFLVHRLCAIKFGILEDYDSDLTVNHLDGNKQNNHWKNLEVVSKSDNNRHAQLTGLRSQSIDYKNEDNVKELLIKHKGSISKVLSDPELMDKTLTYSIISNYKKYLKETFNMNFEVAYTKKISEEMFNEIKNLLIATEGDSNKVLSDLSIKYPALTIHNIKSVKRILINEGFQLRNMKHNRKLSEEEREILINILKANNKSPQKTFDIISNDDRFKNISIYDLKYLKRKYLTN